MATKIKNAIMYLLCSVGLILVMFGGSALDSEDIVFPLVVCVIGMVLLFVPVLILQSKSK